MIVSLPTPDGPEMMTSSAPGAPSMTPSGRPGSSATSMGTSSSTGVRSSLNGRSPPARRPSSDRLELGGQRRRGPDEVPVRRRGQLQSPGVQEQPLEAVRAASRRARAVDRVARDRVADRVEVDADLVRPPGHEVELEQRPVRRTARGRGSRSWTRRPSGTTAIRVRCFGSRPIGASIRPTGAGHDPGDEREVRLAHPARLELRHQRLPAPRRCLATMSSPLVSRSRRWTMPGPSDPGDPAVVGPAGPGEQRVDERVAVVVPGRRVDDEAGRLVDDEQVVVLVDDRQRDVRCGREVAARPAPGRRGGPPSRRVTIELARSGGAVRGRRQAALGDELLDVAARQPGRVGDEPVHAAPVALRDPERSGPRRRRPPQASIKSGSRLRFRSGCRWLAASGPQRPRTMSSRMAIEIARVGDVEGVEAQVAEPDVDQVVDVAEPEAGRSGCRSRRRAAARARPTAPCSGPSCRGTRRSARRRRATRSRTGRPDPGTARTARRCSGRGRGGPGRR